MLPLGLVMQLKEASVALHVYWDRTAGCHLPHMLKTTTGAGGQAGCSREQAEAGISELPLEESPSLHLPKATNDPMHCHCMSNTVPTCSRSLFPPKD